MEETSKDLKTAREQPVLWSFAVKLYGVRSVRECCLYLQDSAGADVNLLLTLLFAASQRLKLDASQVRRLQDSVATWRGGVIDPLRSARRSIKVANHAGVADAYEAAKKAELEAEKVALQILERELTRFGLQPGTSEPAELGGANLDAYASQIASPRDALARLESAFAEFIEARSSGGRRGALRK